MTGLAAGVAAGLNTVGAVCMHEGADMAAPSDEGA